VAFFKSKGWLFKDNWKGERLNCLIVKGENLVADDFKIIAKAKTVQVVNLEGCKQTTDENLKLIAVMPKLEVIIIEGKAVSDAGIKSLAACKTIDSITLQFTTNVTESRVKEFATLPKLKYLAIVAARLPSIFEFDLSLLDVELFESL